MLQVVIRSIGITFVTVAGLALAIEAQAARGPRLHAAAGPVAEEGRPRTPIQAVRAVLLDEPAFVAPELDEAPGAARIEGPVRLPEAEPGVRVNRGLP